MDIINKDKILEHANKLASQGKLDRAIEEYQRILKVNPDDLRVKLKVAELCVKRKQIQEAIRIYQDVASKYQEGSFYLKAVTVYKKILYLNPSIVEINRALAELYEKMGLTSDALHQYQILMKGVEGSSDMETLLTLRKKVVELDPKNVGARIRLAEVYQLKGEMEKAIDEYEAAVGRLGEAPEQLMEVYEKILKYRPDRTQYLKRLCEMRCRRGEWKELLKLLTSTTVASADPELLKMLADVYAKMGQVDNAVARYKELADLCRDHGDVDGALASLEQVLFFDESGAEDLLPLVEGIKAGGFEEIKSRVEIRKKAVAETAAGKVEEGGELIDVKKCLKDAESVYRLGRAYEKMGLHDEAKAEFAKALTLYRKLIAAGLTDKDVMERAKELGG